MELLTKYESLSESVFIGSFFASCLISSTVFADCLFSSSVFAVLFLLFAVFVAICFQLGPLIIRAVKAKLLKCSVVIFSETSAFIFSSCVVCKIFVTPRRFAMRTHHGH